MAHTSYSRKEIAKRGQALYEREIRDQLDAGARGKFLVLDVESGDYELDTNELTALKRARGRRPTGAFYILRVGHPTAYRLGRKATSTTAC